VRFLHAVGFSVEEALAELWRNRLVNLVAIGTIAVSLFVLGVFVSLSANLSRMLAGWSNKIQVTAYLDDRLSASDRNEIERFLRNHPVVGSFEYVSKEEALQRFRSYFDEFETLPSLLDANPFPASFEIQFRPEARSPEQVQQLSQELGARAGVEEVDYDRLWIERLSAIIDLVRLLAVSVGAALAVAAVFTIFNVVKLTVYGRQEEIGIMRLVGATHGYITGPFLIEGILQGGLGGGLALLLLHGSHWLLVERLLVPAKLIAGADWVRLPSAASITICVGGMALGLLGSLLSVRRFLVGRVS
jgi:cell division transport system permease protein